jgi:hypothetical protein
MRQIVVQVGPLAAAAANNIAQSQTPTTAFTLNGTLVSSGVAILDAPRRVKITTGGSESGKTAVVTGTTYGGQVASETVTLPGSATGVDTVLDYKTVTSITVSATLGAAATVGTSALAASSWVFFDGWSSPIVGIQTDVSGTVNYTVQQTFDDPNSPDYPVLPVNVTWVSIADTNMVAATGAKISSFSAAPLYARVLLNSNTNPGYVTGTFQQYGPNRS